MTKKLEPLAGNFGLNLHWDPTETPGEAALFQAKNVLSREGRLESRRGFKGVGATDANNVPIAYAEYQGKLLRMKASNLTSDDTHDLQWLNEGTDDFEDLNTSPSMQLPIDATRHRFQETNTVNLITDRFGTWAQDDATALPKRAGAVEAHDGRARPFIDGGIGSGFMGQTQVAYQVIFIKKNALGQEIRSAPLRQPIRFTNNKYVGVTWSRVGGTSPDDERFLIDTREQRQYESEPFWAGYAINDVIQVENSSEAALDGQWTLDQITDLIYVDTNTPIASGSGTLDFFYDCNVKLDITEPYVDPGISPDTGLFACEIYRTVQSADVNTAPGNEFLKVARIEKGDPGWTTRTIEFTDTVADPFLGERLYTNPSRGTVARSNDRPPSSADVVFFKGHTIYANLARESFVEIQLTDASAAYLNARSTGASWTLNINTTPTTYTLTARTTVPGEDASLAEFACGDPVNASLTDADAVRATAQSIVAMGNRQTTWPFRFYYNSGPNDAPGKILIKSMQPGIDPAGLPDVEILDKDSAALTGVFDIQQKTFSTNVAANTLAISKFEEPEAVPEASDQPVGNDDAIVRLAALRDAVLIFKERGGMYVLSGQSDGTVGDAFSVVVRDQTVRIDGQNTLSVLNNAAYLYTDLGFVRAKEAGAEIIGRKIERELRRIRGVNSDWDRLANSAAYTSENLYLCWTPEVSTDTTPTRCWSYDVLLNEWTNAFDRPSSAAHYRIDNDKLYLGIPIGGDSLVTTLEERKSYDEDNDHYDEEIAVTFTAPAAGSWRGSVVDIVQLTFTSTYLSLEPGWLVEQSGKTANVVEVVDLGGDTYQLKLDDFGFAAGAANLRAPIEVLVETRPIDGRSSVILKQFTDGVVEFEENDATEHEIGFVTDYKPTATLMPVTTRSRDNTFEEAQSRSLAVRVPVDFQKGRWMRILYRHIWGGQPVSILEISAAFREIGMRSTYRAPKFS